MQVGDIYRFKPEFLDTYHTWVKSPAFPGNGPWEVIEIRGDYCDVKSLETGRIHTGWAANPAHWGFLDPFLTAAYQANNHA